MPIFGKKNKKGQLTVNLVHTYGVAGYTKGTAVAVSVDDENKCITVISRVYKNPPVHLKFEQIISVNTFYASKIRELNKNAIDKAMVEGKKGKIIEGISEADKGSNLYMIIEYKSKDDEVNLLNFEISGSSYHWSSFVDELRARTKTQKVKEEEIFL
jgi:hypothetical protein